MGLALGSGLGPLDLRGPWLLPVCQRPLLLRGFQGSLEALRSHLMLVGHAVRPHAQQELITVWCPRKIQKACDHSMRVCRHGQVWEYALAGGGSPACLRGSQEAGDASGKLRQHFTFVSRFLLHPDSFFVHPPTHCLLLSALGGKVSSKGWLTVVSG